MEVKHIQQNQSISNYKQKRQQNDNKIRAKMWKIGVERQRGIGIDADSKRTKEDSDRGRNALKIFYERKERLEMAFTQRDIVP